MDFKSKDSPSGAEALNSGLRSFMRSFFGRKVCSKTAIIAARSRPGKRGRTGKTRDGILPSSASSSAVRSKRGRLRYPSPATRDADTVEMNASRWESEREFHIYSGG